VVVGLLVSAATLGRPVEASTSGGAGWLPADGHRQRFTGPDGVRVTEWALDQAVAIIGSGPAPFVTWLGFTEVDWQRTLLARLSTVRLPSAAYLGGRSDDLFSLGSDGVRTEVESGFDGTSRVYAPGRLDLPDALAAGRTWTSEGGVVITDAAGNRDSSGYRAEYTAITATDKELLARACVVVTMREQIGNAEPTTTERTWCRHAGLIAYGDPQGSWRATDATNASSAVPPDAPFDWSTADRLRFTPRKVNVTGAGTTFVTPVSPPGILPDGTAVFSHGLTGEVMALQTGADPPTQVWRARPGVRNTAAATFGTTTVVASVNRRLVGYGPDGAWLWDSPLSDLIVVPPVRLGDLVVTTGLDGGVTAHDLGTGVQRWRQDVGSEVRVAPQVSGRRLLVIDQGGQLTCFDATGATVWTATVGEVERFGVTTGDNPVVVVPSSNGPRVTGLALADGSQLWRARHSVTTRDVVALDDVVVLRDDDETIGVDPVTGQRVWSRRGDRTYDGIGGGVRVLVLAIDRLVLLDARGDKVNEWPVEVGDVSVSDSWLAAAQGRVVVLGPAGAAIGVVAP